MALNQYLDFLVTTPARFGQITHFREDDPIGRSLLCYGEWAEAEIDLLTRLVRQGDTVVDVGANVGTHTLALAKAVGQTGSVVAFEPQPVIYELLARNVDQNGASQVRTEACALGSRTAHVSLSIPDYLQHHNSGGAHVRQGLQMALAEVPVRCLDEWKLDRCSLIKIDVEGFEREVLMGAHQTLDRCKPILYAECNVLANGWDLIQWIGSRYQVWLHSPSAFNPNNFRDNKEDVFGLARETNLLFIPRDRAPLLASILEATPHLELINTLDDFASAFMQVTRFGEHEIAPDQARANARRVTELELTLSKNASLQAASLATRLTRPVHVLVPIYNGLDDFKKLAHSMFEAHPLVNPLLTFVFIDDGSPDARVGEFLKTDVFRRKDVVRLKNEKNLGFIGTINRGLEAYAFGPDGTDIIIVNSDTQIHGNVFSIMQDVAYRVPNVASVTPMTNNGTIASLWKWPEGSDLYPGISPVAVARAVENARVKNRLIDAPTGVGFCMYMTQAALCEVGGFDSVFGKGYGEENHWCQTAAKSGFINVISTEAFVYHHGSVSFGNETKRLQLETNMEILSNLNPRYLSDVTEYIETDSLRTDRLKVQWAVRRQKKAESQLHTVLFLLHNDPSYFGGGTERHVQALTEALLAKGNVEVMHVFPLPDGRFCLKTYFESLNSSAPSYEFLSEVFGKDDVFPLLREIAPDVDTLHVHHFLGWPRWFARLPDIFHRARRYLTLHDYLAACPSIRLMSGGKFCEVPSDLKQCDLCLKTEHRYEDSAMREYRQYYAGLIERYDRVFVPSASARQILLRAFEVVEENAGRPLSDRVAPKVEVLSNFLLGKPVPIKKQLSGDPSKQPRIIYLGAFVEPKGALLFSEAATSLLERGYQVEVWGALDVPVPQGATHRMYRNSEQLRSLATEFPVDVVCIPAVWPETFSFTTFEAAVTVGAPVVVGPFGNPADLVRAHGIGVVIPVLDSASLIAAIDQCLSQRPAFVARLSDFYQHAQKLTVGSFIGEAYGALTPPDHAPLGTTDLLPVPSRSIRERTIAPERPPQPQIPPLRYRLADQANLALKQAVPYAHTFGRWLVVKVGRKAQRMFP